MKKIIASAALTASMVGGGFVGAAVLGGTALAQDDADTDDPTTDTESPRKRGHAHLEELAAVLNTDAETLRDALRGGQTLAEFADAQGVPGQTVIDSLVAHFQERVDAAVEAGRLTAEEAAEKEAGFEEQATDILNGDAPLRGGGRHGGPGGIRGAGLDDLAATLETDAESLRAALQDGQSIADVAEANGVDVQEVIDEMIAQAEQRLDEAVADGRITEDEAADKTADIAERVDDVVNGEAPLRGPRGPRGPGGDGPPADAPEVQASVFGTA